MLLNGDVCPLCGADEPRSFAALPSDIVDSQHMLSLFECPSCGLAWQYPMQRDPHQSVGYFEHAYCTAVTGTYFDRSLKREICEMQARILGHVAPTPGTLLDIGAGDGAFIAQLAQAGWQCTGVDPAAPDESDAQVVGAGSARMIRGILDTLDPQVPFAAITAWDVIEHVERPDELIARALERLASEGALIIETGNYESASRIEGGSTWWGYQADHRWYFSPANLTAMLKRAGLDHVLLVNSVARPQWRGAQRCARPSLLRTMKGIVRSPTTIGDRARRYWSLTRAARAWPYWSGLDIFALIGSRAPIQPSGGETTFTDLSGRR